MILEGIRQLVWSPVTLLLVLGAGVFLSVRCRFFQFRRLGHIFSATAGSLLHPEKKTGGHRCGISPYQAFATALAGTVGVGNIAGVAGAVALGGPGALFWMWVSAFLGMGLKFSEILLAVRFRRTGPEGEYYGGPMYYMEKGMHCRILAVLFSLAGALNCLCSGAITQSAEITAGVANLTDGKCPPLLTAALLFAVTLLSACGGIRRLGKISSGLLPVMAFVYLGTGLILIFSRLPDLPGAFSRILGEAFSLRPAAGGIAGYGFLTAMRSGLARGLFSNEAGLGTAPMAHAAADDESAVRQGLWGVLEVFVDTICICTVTGLIVILSGVDPGAAPGGMLASLAYETFFSGGGKLVSFSLCLFALTTVLGWEYYGEICWRYLFPARRRAAVWFRIFYLLSVFAGAALSFFTGTAGQALSWAWLLTDIGNGLMLLPNLIAVIALSSLPARCIKQYFGWKLSKNREKSKISRL